MGSAAKLSSQGVKFDLPIALLQLGNLRCHSSFKFVTSVITYVLLLIVALIKLLASITAVRICIDTILIGFSLISAAFIDRVHHNSIGNFKPEPLNYLFDAPCSLDCNC